MQFQNVTKSFSRNYQGNMSDSPIGSPCMEIAADTFLLTQCRRLKAWKKQTGRIIDKAENLLML